MMRGRQLVAVWAIVCACGANAVEKNYDFRARLGILHPPRRAGDAAPVRPDETAIDASWRIVTESDDPVIRHAAADLADYFAKSMNERVVWTGETASAQSAAATGRKPHKTISIGLSAETNALTARVAVTADRVRITGATAREAAQGCYRLEDAMNFRGAPVVARGERTYTRMFSPRMVHSGWELDRYPDVYLDHLAHAGMDAVLVYVTESPDMTRNGREDMPDLVRRARERGLDVYVYAHQIAASSHMHPDDPDAAEFCDRLWGSIVKNAPGLKGMVFVGESIAFTSKDPTIGGFWWKRDPKTPRTNGFWPTLEWVPWLERVRDATRKYNPNFDIVFWTYNWSRAPEKDRLALLERVPTDITVHVTFEMGDARPVRNGVDDDIDDYSILGPGPSRMFAGEAEVISRRGIRLTSMANTGGRTWDCGVVPFEPVPERWLDRHRALRQAHRKWNLSGLMESHHYGFQPNFIAEIAKASFTEEADDASVRETLRGIAARDFGTENVKAVLAAWHDWSEAFLFHSACWFDQGGPLRIGPTFALVLPGEPWPLPPHPQYEWYEGWRYGNGWKYLCSEYSMPPDQFDGRLATTERELALWRQGNARLAAALAHVPAVKRPFAERMLGLGRFYEHTIRTVGNSIRFKRDGLVLTDPKASAAEKLAAAKRLDAVLDDEEANVRETIPLVEADSTLGWEPSMFYVADREHLEWKLRQLNDARKAVSARSPGSSGRSQAGCAREIAVSPAGLSPQAAIETIRAARGAGSTDAWTVRVAPGRYHLSSPLVFEPQDSGMAAAPTRWIGEKGAEFSVGVPVTGWTDGGDGVWSAPIPKKADGSRALVEQLWVNGRRAPRSPLPKNGRFRPGRTTYAPVTNGAIVVWKEEMEMTDLSVRQALAAADEQELLHSQLLVWRVFSYASRVIRGYDAARGVTTAYRPFPRQAWDNFDLNQDGKKKNQVILCQVENLRAGFTEPGEWLFDAKAGRVRYRPLPGETIAALDAVGSVGGASRVLELRGEPKAERFVEHISFENIAFAHTAVPLRWTCCEIDPKYTVPVDHALDGAPAGASQTYCHQAANGCDGAVTMNGARHVTFRKCSVAHTGNYAFDLPTGCWHTGILDCEMTDLGAGGVKLGPPLPTVRLKDGSSPDRGIIEVSRFAPDGVAFNVISNCLIRDGGHRQAEGAGVAVLHASDTKVVQCEIADLLYSGISFGIVWGYDGSVAQRNEAAFNHIHHLGGGVMSDLAGVYTLGTSFGTRIHDNVIHDISCAPMGAEGYRGYGGWGIYHDEGTEGVLTERNLVYNTEDGSFFQHYGARNVVRNNIFAWNGRDGAIRVQSGTPHRNPSGVDFVNNIVLVRNTPLVPPDGADPDGWVYRLAGTWAGNVWHDVGGKADFGGLDFAGWMARRRDIASVCADPLFADAEKFDFRLMSGSPAGALGFRAWDVTYSGRK